MGFAHLHVHTQYSLLDGAAEIGRLAEAAAEQGFDSLAITDHGVMYGAVEFYTAVKSKGIKPIIGCEVYTAPRSRFDKVHGIDSQYGHLVLLARNNTGYKNLMKLVSLSYSEGYYYKPRVDDEILKKYSEGLIALSACLRGDVPMAVLGGGVDAGVRAAQKYCDIFGKENFFIELQDHGIPEEKRVIDGLAEVAHICGAGLVATNDVHYVDSSDAFLQDVLTCIQTGSKLDDTDRLKFEGSEFYLKSEDDMRTLFAKYPEAIENTEKIAAMCNVTLDFDTMHLPAAMPDTDKPHDVYLKELCTDGVYKKYQNPGEEIFERLDYELGVINSMGYTDYFLIVWDFIAYAKRNHIMVGPGRGSAAGSLVAYVLNITEIDPLKYDLIFERFLNPERVSMPDIDVDFCYERRDEVKEYVVNKYGVGRVAQIATFGTMAARAAIRDVGRVMGCDPSLVDKAAKSVPEMLHIKLKDAIDMDAELRSMYSGDPVMRRLLDTAMALEGFPRNVSTHAAGIVIADAPLDNYVPLQTADTGMITQYPMAALEKLGLLKMDFLGLRNLTVIRDAIAMTEKYEGVRIDLKNLDYEDKATFDMISDGDTDGVFQLENPGLRTFMQKFRPHSIEDVILTTSIYRPGPMEQIPQFLKNVKNPRGITYMHPLLEPILRPTYGAIIYQEQVMEIVRSLAGYSFGRADLVRRAMAKKKHSVMEKEREIFIHGLVEDGVRVIDGAVNRGVEETTANAIFDYLIDFANYAFNKSHAACYATVAYQTAYLKRHYPVEFLVALLMSLTGNSYKINKYIRVFGKYGIYLLPPDINKSCAQFAVEGRNVRFALSALKNVGIQFPHDVEAEREHGGVFKSFSDFVVRMSAYDTNRRTIETLIKCGAFDSLYPNRKALVTSFEKMFDYASADARLAVLGQVSLFGDDSASVTDGMIERIADYTDSEKLDYEKEFSGMYLSAHPLDGYLLKAKAFSQCDIYSLSEGNVPDDGKVRVCGVVTGVHKKRTKKGVLIVTMTLSDYYSDIELVAFEKKYDMYSRYLTDGSVLFVEATVSDRGKKNISLSLVSAVPLDGLSVADSKRLYVRVPDDSSVGSVTEITSRYCGKSGLNIYLSDSKTVLRASDDRKVRLCNELIKELCDKFGDENIKIT